MALLSLLHTTKLQYRKTVNHVFSEMLTYPMFSPKRWKELTQAPGQEHTDRSSFVETDGKDVIL